MARNLLKNPSGEGKMRMEDLQLCMQLDQGHDWDCLILCSGDSPVQFPYSKQLEFWDLTENGGSQWKVEDMPGDCGYDFCSDGVTKYFATSFELCLKRQVIDLLAEGYSSEQLDAQPVVKVEDWYCGRTDCGCTYQMTVCLLDENHEIIQEFKPEPVTLDPDCDDCSWKQVSHTFSDYGPGMRHISFEHGGQDTKFWDGWFGVRVTGSSITVEV